MERLMMNVQHNMDRAGRTCTNHPQRGGVAGCIRCKRIFCHECLTDHNDFLLCTTCLSQKKEQTKSQETEASDPASAEPKRETALKRWLNQCQDSVYVFYAKMVILTLIVVASAFLGTVCFADYFMME